MGVGAYRDNNGKPFKLESVKRAEKIVFEKDLDHEYLPVQGNDNFVKLSLGLAYGDNCKPVQEGRVAAVQTLSGCGGVRVGWEFCKKYLPKDTQIYIPKPSWPVHNNIPGEIGMPMQNYAYFHPQTRGLDFNGLMNDLGNAPDNSVVVLHACSHNPTGVDPTKE